MQRVLVCGDRNWAYRDVIRRVLHSIREADGIECVIEGEARGADTLGRLAAVELGIRQIYRFPAKWQEYGKAAGPIRNQQMLDEGKPTLVIAFHDDIANSRGTADMIRRARKVGLEVRIYNHLGERT